VVGLRWSDDEAMDVRGRILLLSCAVDEC